MKDNYESVRNGWNHKRMGYLVQTFRGNETWNGSSRNEKKVHVIMETESMEKAKEFSSNPEVNARRVEAGVVVESTVMVPLKDWLFY